MHYKPYNHDWFTKRNLTPPESINHGDPDGIRDKMVKLKPTTWRMEGNKLIGDTELGQLVNFIPTNMILTGTDEAGMPVFRRIG